MYNMKYRIKGQFSIRRDFREGLNFLLSSKEFDICSIKTILWDNRLSFCIIGEENQIRKLLQELTLSYDYIILKIKKLIF